MRNTYAGLPGLLRQTGELIEALEWRRWTKVTLVSSSELRRTADVVVSVRGNSACTLNHGRQKVGAAPRPAARTDLVPSMAAAPVLATSHLPLNQPNL